MSSSGIDLAISQYLKELDQVLGPLPSHRRKQILEEVARHIDDARSELIDPSEASVRGILDRLGSPEEIANEALAGVMELPRHHWRQNMTASIVLVAVLAISSAALVISLNGARGQENTPSHQVGTHDVVIVPTVIGESEILAKALLASVGLHAVLAQRPTDVGSGRTVVSQNPRMGTRVRFATNVRLST
jgi:hypothetical protein